MKVIYNGRGAGKTTELIKICAKQGGYIVCHSFNEAHRIFKQAKKLNLNIPLPISYQEFVNKEYYAKEVKKFHIDNVYMLVVYLSEVPIETITLTIPTTTAKK